MGDLQLVQAAPQPREVAGRVGQLAAEHRPHLVDAVGQLVAAILDMHGGLAMADEAAVHIGETRHRLKFLPDESRDPSGMSERPTGNVRPKLSLGPDFRRDERSWG
jgi:hypothetical protein